LSPGPYCKLYDIKSSTWGSQKQQKELARVLHSTKTEEESGSHKIKAWIFRCTMAIEMTLAKEEICKE
jgi:hypothetical protein